MNDQPPEHGAEILIERRVERCRQTAWIVDDAGEEVQSGLFIEGEIGEERVRVASRVDGARDPRAGSLAEERECDGTSCLVVTSRGHEFNLGSIDD